MISRTDSAAFLLRSELHAVVTAPALEAVNSLNEVIGRFPDAISFAPGAPHPKFFDTLDVGGFLDRYVDHVRQKEKLTEVQVRRRIYQYGPSRGLINDLVATVLQRDMGISVPAKSIVMTVGAQEAMLLTLRALCAGRDDLLAVVTPCYVGIIGAARFLDMELVPVSEGEQGVDLAQLGRVCGDARAAGKRIRALYVAPDCSNPSGTVMELSCRLGLLELANREDFFVLEDSTYGFTMDPQQQLPSLKALDRANRVIYLSTFSKTCLPGTRVGYVIADQAVLDGDDRRLLADEIASLKTMSTVNTSPICQAIIGGMLLASDCSLVRLAAGKSAGYQENLARLLTGLEREIGSGGGVSWNKPAGGFFLRMRLPVIVDRDLLDISARRFGVLWTPMVDFYPGQAQSSELRLSCSYLDPAQIDEGVRRLAAFVNHVRSENLITAGGR
jgi:(S)-3,5-dihydroxyphenylglycine transaminase